MKRESPSIHSASHVIEYLVILTLFLAAGNVSAQSPKLKMYGYFDMEVEVSNKDAAGKIWTFDQHHLNIITIYRVAEQFRVFSEIEWEHGPSHKADEITGKIYLATAFVEYKNSDAFQVRVGKFLSPFGLYNERHDATPTFISTKLPHFVYNEIELSTGVKGRLYSKFSTGIQVLGRLYASSWEGIYQLYLSNGRGASPYEKDDNPNKGIGARLVISTPIEDLRLGTSYYADRNGKVGNIRQSALGFDAELDYSNFHLESEMIFHENELIDTTGMSSGVFISGFGYYALAAYTIFDKLTPFAGYEFHDHHVVESGVDETRGMIGINYSFTPRVYLKNEVHFHNFTDDTREMFEMYLASIAVAF